MDAVRIAAQDLSRRMGVGSFAETKLASVLRRLPDCGEGGPWLAGGAVRRALQDEPLNSDFDFFFANEAQADAFEMRLRATGSQIAKTDKATTFVVPAVMSEDGKRLPELKVQAVRFQFFPSPATLIDTFDFTLSQFAYDGAYVYVGPFALWDVARKRIVIHRVSYGVSTLRRLLKYTRQGYTVCSGALAELLQQVVADPGVIQSTTEYID